MRRPSGSSRAARLALAGALAAAAAAAAQPASTSGAPAAAAHASQASSPAALGFASALAAALAYDAQFEAAQHERESARIGVEVARASLLPTLSFSASDGRTVGIREFPNSLNQQVTQDVDYRTPQFALQLRAPIFNYESLSRYRQAIAQSGGAEALYAVRRVELLDRLALAYLQCILADENVRLSQTQVDWLEAQVRHARERVQRGEGTRIEMADATTQLEQARSRLIDARDQAAISRRSLARITGIDGSPALPGVDERTEAAPLVPLDLAEWQTLAAGGNPSIRVRERSVEIARHAVERQSAGHLPRLDAVAAVARSSNDSSANLNQSSRLASLGLQLNVPLYSGGGVDASVRQARADQSRTEAELTHERRNVDQEVQRQYRAVTSGAERVASYRQAEAAGQVLLEGMTRGMAAGLRTQADVLEAGARLALARRDLAQARIEVLLGRLRLQALSGVAPADVAADLDRLLARR